MIWRLVGMVLSFGLIGYLLYVTLGSNSAVDKSINSNATVVEQKKALESAGVNAEDKQQLRAYIGQQEKQLEEYKHQADGLEGVKE